MVVVAFDVAADEVFDDDHGEHSDGSIEGRVARSLFYEQEEDDDDDEVLPSRCDQDDNLLSNVATCLEDEGSDAETITTQILHVRITSKKLGGTIAERVWPAAAHLAEFILDLGTFKDGATQRELRTLKACSDEPGTARSAQQELQKQMALSAVRNLLLQSQTPDTPLPVLELGAGVGLTGLELATQLYTEVLLTDLPVGIALLRQNVDLNKNLFRLKRDDDAPAVTVQKLEWGNDEDHVDAMRWVKERVSSRPVLILGSDCVYWEELHEPLERTIFSLLSQCAPGSLCVLAGMRRWKRDNAFYQTLGKRTRTAEQQLRCTCVQETVTRSDDGQREVMRVFVVEITDRE